jgi:hypothetical protein
MNRRFFLRVLLSLMLLMSQQMAIAHAMGHVINLRAAATAGTSQADNADLAKAIAQDQSCSQCLAFAQLGGPLGHAPALVTPLEFASSPVISLATEVPRSRAAWFFESRAPPFSN